MVLDRDSWISSIPLIASAQPQLLLRMKVPMWIIEPPLILFLLGTSFSHIFTKLRFSVLAFLRTLSRCMFVCDCLFSSLVWQNIYCTALVWLSEWFKRHLLFVSRLFHLGFFHEVGLLKEGICHLGLLLSAQLFLPFYSCRKRLIGAWVDFGYASFEIMAYGQGALCALSSCD